MTLSLAEQMIYSTLQIEMLEENMKTVGYASGFIFSFCYDEKSRSGVQSLVTNRHVLKDCKKIRIIFTAKNEDGTPNHGKNIPVVLNTSESTFHPNPNIDLAILPLGATIISLVRQNKEPFFTFVDSSHIPSADEWNGLNAIEGITMVGYPQGLRDAVNNLPVVRQGITGTNPKYDYQGCAQFLMDMACFPGSSGSPVFLYNEGTFYDRSKNTIAIGSRMKLLGIQFSAPVASTRAERDR